MNKSRLWLAISLLVIIMGLLGIGIFTLISVLLEDDTPAQDYNDVLLTERGTEAVREIIPPREVLDFSLPTQTGETMSLSALEGQHVLMFFGYTHCPDVCPLTVFDLKQVYEMLGEAAQDVAFLFVSVDNERDDPEKLARFFDSRRVSDFMIGMAADDNTLQRISADYRLFYEKQDNEDANGYYTVDHTANIYLLDPERKLSHIFAFGTEPEVIADELRALLTS